VVLGYVASQLVVVPHAHVEAGSLECHSLQPHIHVGWFGNGSNVRHRDQGVPRHQSFETGGDNDHDHDTVYLSNIYALMPLFHAHASDWFVQLSTTGQLYAITSTAGCNTVRTFQQCHPPNPIGEHCALILKLRTLRI